MHKVQIPDTRVDKCFEWRQRNTLEDSRPEQAIIIAPTGSTPYTADDQENVTQKVQVAFAPYSCGCHEEEACHSHAA